MVQRNPDKRKPFEAFMFQALKIIELANLQAPSG
jgi:hypothetical protein